MQAPALLSGEVGGMHFAALCDTCELSPAASTGATVRGGGRGAQQCNNAASGERAGRGCRDEVGLPTCQKRVRRPGLTAGLNAAAGNLPCRLGNGRARRVEACHVDVARDPYERRRRHRRESKRLHGITAVRCQHPSGPPQFGRRAAMWQTGVSRGLWSYRNADYSSDVPQRTTLPTRVIPSFSMLLPPPQHRKPLL